MAPAARESAPRSDCALTHVTLPNTSEQPIGTADASRFGVWRRVRTIVWAALVVAVSATQIGAPLAAAQIETDEIIAMRDKRDAQAQQQVELARFVEPLLAENAELENALRVLEDHLTRQQISLAGLQQEIAQAENEVLLANAAVGEKTIEIAALRQSLTARAIEAYLQPQGDGMSNMLTSADLSEAGRRRALADAVVQREVDVLDALRGAESRLEGLVREAELAVERVEAKRVEEEAQAAELQMAIADANRARVALDERVQEVQVEIDGYALQESESQRVIDQLVVEERSRLAEIERQRIAAEQAALEAERARLAALTVPPVVAQETEQPTTVELAEPEPVNAPDGGSMTWPASGPVTSGFGPRWGRMHEGLDIAVNQGSRVVAASGGTVVYTGLDGGYGNAVVINHGGGITTRYAHLSSIGVSTGQSVSQGASIGLSGGDPGTQGAGSSTGAHLHFEVRVSGTAYNPYNYLG